MDNSRIKSGLIAMVLAGSLLVSSGCTALRLYYPAKSLSEAVYHCIADDKKDDKKEIKYDPSINEER